MATTRKVSKAMMVEWLDLACHGCSYADPLGWRGQFACHVEGEIGGDKIRTATQCRGVRAAIVRLIKKSGRGK